MLQDLFRAIGCLRDPRIRSLVWLGIGLALLVILALGGIAEAIIVGLSDTGHVWLDRLLAGLGAVGTVLLAWLLFPSVVVAVSGLLLDRVFAILDPGPARAVPVTEQVVAALRLLLLSLAINLLLLPLYLIPVVNIVLWLALNGWLVAREYVEAGAARRLPPDEVTALRKRHSGRFWLAGMLVAAALGVPILNLAVPVLGACFMAFRLRPLLPR